MNIISGHITLSREIMKQILLYLFLVLVSFSIFGQDNSNEAFNLSSSNPYVILGLSKTAFKSEIKKAFRDAVKVFHPDKNTELSSNENFRIVKDAYMNILEGKITIDGSFIQLSQEEEANIVRVLRSSIIRLYRNGKSLNEISLFLETNLDLLSVLDIENITRLKEATFAYYNISESSEEAKSLKDLFSRFQNMYNQSSPCNKILLGGGKIQLN